MFAFIRVVSARPATAFVLMINQRCFDVAIDARRAFAVGLLRLGQKLVFLRRVFADFLRGPILRRPVGRDVIEHDRATWDAGLDETPTRDRTRKYHIPYIK